MCMHACMRVCVLLISCGCVHVSEMCTRKACLTTLPQDPVCPPPILGIPVLGAVFQTSPHCDGPDPGVTCGQRRVQFGESVCFPSWGGADPVHLPRPHPQSVARRTGFYRESCRTHSPGQAAWPASGLGEEGIGRGRASAGARGSGFRLSSARGQLGALGQVTLFLGPPVPIEDRECESHGLTVIFSVSSQD